MVWPQVGLLNINWQHISFSTGVVLSDKKLEEHLHMAYSVSMQWHVKAQLRSVSTPEVWPGAVELDVVDNAVNVEVELVVKEVCEVWVELVMELLERASLTIVMSADVDAIDLSITALVADE